MGFTSAWHWVVVLLVIVLLFGAKKLPELASGVGKSIKNFKKEMQNEEENSELATTQKPQQESLNATTQEKAQTTTQSKMEA